MRDVNLLIFVFTQAMSPEVVANVSGAIQWEDSDTEEAQDSKLRQKPTSQRNANQILDIPGNEVSHLNFFLKDMFLIKLFRFVVIALILNLNGLRPTSGLRFVLSVAESIAPLAYISLKSSQLRWTPGNQRYSRLWRSWGTVLPTGSWRTRSEIILNLDLEQLDLREKLGLR